MNSEQEVAAIRGVIVGINNAMHALELDLERLQASLDAGISLDVIGAINRAVMAAKEPS